VNRFADEIDMIAAGISAADRQRGVGDAGAPRGELRCGRSSG
jgi:hypothetical protein